MDLRTRVFLRALGLLWAMILAVTLVSGASSVTHQRQYAQAIYQGQVRTLALQMANQVLWDDRVGLYNLMVEVVNKDRALGYAFLERDGKPYVYTFPEGVPEGLLGLGPFSTERATVTPFEDQTGQQWFDVAQAVPADTAALHLGVNVKVLFWQALAGLREVLLVSGAALLAGALFAWNVARATTREIRARQRAELELRASRNELIEANRVLKASEERLVEAQRMARLGRWEWHLDTDHWEWTPEVCRFFELPASAAPSLEAMLAPLSPQDQSLLRRSLDQAAHGGDRFELLLHLGAGIGEIKFAQVRGEAVHDQDGKVGRVVGTLQDISINQFSIEKAGEAVFWISKAGRFVYMNEAACDLVGYPRNELLSLTASDLNPEHPQHVFEDHFNEIKNSGSMCFGTSLIRKDGRSVPIEICSNYLAYAGDEYNIAFARDMTEHKATEARILRLNDIYAALSHTNQAIIHSKDRQELFDSLVHVAAEYGHFRAAWIGIVDEVTKDVPVVASVGNCREYVDRLKISVAAGSPSSEGATGRCIRFGRPQVVNDFIGAEMSAPWQEFGAAFGLKSVAAFPITNHGRTVGALSLYSDVAGFFSDDLIDLLTEMSGDISFGLDRLDLMAANERQEAELRTAVDRLTVSNSELERFAYVASHDLQEPLRTIVSFTQLLDRRLGASLPPEDRENFAFIVEAAKRMSLLINDLLAYSRVNNDVQFARLPLRQACASAVDNLREAVSRSGAEISVGTLPDVVGDSVQLVQLFQNLIGNAIKFRRAEVPPRVVVSSERRDGEWVVTIADNGIGIAVTDQDIFEIFRRLHSSSRFPGSGVGLAICKRIIQRHNGRIWYDTRQGEGTSFHFTLPVPPEQPPPLAAA